MTARIRILQVYAPRLVGRRYFLVRKVPYMAYKYDSGPRGPVSRKIISSRNTKKMGAQPNLREFLVDGGHRLPT